MKMYAYSYIQLQMEAWEHMQGESVPFSDILLLN